MPTPDVHVHYINVNVEGRLPHVLKFDTLHGRLVTNQPISGRVITIVSYGQPRRYFVWSTFEASVRVEEYRGQTVVQGPGWCLCPPYEIEEDYVDYLIGGQFREHLFVPVADEGIAKWLLEIADRYQPPGNPARLRAFLDQLYQNIGNEEIEVKIARLKKTIKS